VEQVGVVEGVRVGERAWLNRKVHEVSLIKKKARPTPFTKIKQNYII